VTLLANPLDPNLTGLVSLILANEGKHSADLFSVVFTDVVQRALQAPEPMTGDFYLLWIVLEDGGVWFFRWFFRREFWFWISWRLWLRSKKKDASFFCLLRSKSATE
jgi:hypothetical protein